MPKLLVSLRGPNVLLSLSLSPYALLRPLTLKKEICILQINIIHIGQSRFLHIK